MLNYRPYIHKFESEFGLPPGLLAQLIRAESGGNPNAKSPVGAIGLGQLMPATAKGLGVNPYDPVDNLRGAAKYLSQQLNAFKSVPLALAAYNAGGGAVRKYNGIPPYAETRAYVKRIMGNWGGGPGHVKETGASIPVKNSVVGHKPPILDTSKWDKMLRNVQSWSPGGEFQDSIVRKANLGKSRELNRYAAALEAPSFLNPPSPQSNVRLGKNPFSVFENRFGLTRSSSDNDAQGVHVGGSYHYQKAPWGVRGYDYGDARNDPSTLNQVGQFIKRHPNIVKGIKEAYYDPWGFRVENGQILQGPLGGHDDHLHLAF